MSAAGSTNNHPWFQRACLLVRDIEQALIVYRDLLGFELNYLGDDAAESFSYEIFRIPKTIQTRFATLSSPKQIRTLAFIEVPDDDFFVTSQMDACVIRVNSVEETLALAKQIGLECCEIRREESPLRGPARSESAFYDYDGRPVVIFEYLEEVPAE